MLAEERRARILEVLKSSQAVTVRELSRMLGASERTIRRDLAALARYPFVRRTHGGAVSANVGDGAELTLLERYRLSTSEKERIGKAAVALLHPHDRVIIDAGSTAYEVARQIPQGMPLVVITHAVNVVHALLDKPDVEVILCGGTLRRSTLSLVGPDTVSAYGAIRADIAFLGATGVTPELEFVNANRIETEVKKAIIRVAQRSVVLVDHTKFGKLALMPFASPSSGITGVITDRRAPADYVKRFRQAGVWVQVV
ncbi:MAG TPA: DeoR/GlpR family DNA-binding transcription regulator [Limnochordales bacterium]